MRIDPAMNAIAMLVSTREYLNTGLRIAAAFRLALLLLALLSLALPAEARNRGGIEFAFDAARVEHVGSADYLSFNVLAKGTTDADRLGTGMLLINYNTGSFGLRVHNNNNLIVSRASLLQTSPANFYVLYTMDNLSNRLAITYEYISSAGNGNPLGLDFQPLMNVKLKIQNYGLTAGLSFHATGMAMQQYLDDNATLFNPVVATDTEAGVIPTWPQGVASSIQNGSMVLSWEAVSGCTYNVYSCSDLQYGSWELEENGLTATQWSSNLTSEPKFYYVTAQSGQ